MSKLQDIPIKVEPARLETSHDGADMLVPILHELLGMLRTLSSSGQGNILDLRHEPLSLDDIAELKNILGQGEIDVSLNTLGRTSIRETSVSGIWWITHYDQEGDIVDECIEISLCPEILKTSAEDLQPAIGRLQDKLNQYRHQSTPDDIDKRLGELGFSLKNVIPDMTN